MSRRLVMPLLLAGSCMGFLLTIAWPTVALLTGWIVEGLRPQEGYTFSSRQWSLLGRSVWLSCTAAVLCVLLALPLAFLLGRATSIGKRRMLAALLLAQLLCPPMVYAFGWERLWPMQLSGSLRCIAVWFLWAWPIPALLVGSGWTRVGRRAYEAALLDASPGTAFCRVALPSLLPNVAMSIVILVLLFLNDYGVPHACLIQVYATELLGWAANSNRIGTVLWLAIPMVAATSAGVLTLVALWRKCGSYVAPNDMDARPLRPSVGAAGWTVALLGLSSGVPLAGLLTRLTSPTELTEAIQVYAVDAMWTLLTGVVAGLLSVGIGLGICAAPGIRLVALLWVMAVGACPGALIGAAFIAAYNHPFTAALYDHWPIVTLSYTARFVWIAMLLGWHTHAVTGRDLLAQASTDGAETASILGRILLPLHGPLLLGGVWMILVLSMGEVPASSLVRVPDFTPIAHVLLEKFHRFEDGMLVSLSLWIVALAVLPGLLWAIAGRRSKQQ